MSENPRAVEFVYDFVSTPCHIAWKCLERMVAPVGGKVILTPVLCGAIFKAIGNPGPLVIPAKREWYARDLDMWARRRGVRLVQSPHIPVRSLPLMRGSLVAAERDETATYVDAIFDAIYVHQRNLSDLQLVRQTLNEVELDANAYFEAIERPDIKEDLTRNTDDAVRRGVFGVPSFFVNGELFFGQDRLEFVVEALQRSLA